MSPFNTKLYEELGLLYEIPYISSQLSDDPTAGQLDSDAFLDGKDRCWQALSTTKIKEKKTLILSSWYFHYLDQKAQTVWNQFFGELIDDGFNVYIPAENCLIKLSDKSQLLAQLISFTPITKATALKWAARLQLSNEQTDVINLERLVSLDNLLVEIHRRSPTMRSHLSILFESRFPIMPSSLTIQQMREIETLIEPTDQFDCEYPENTSLEGKLKQHIFTLTITLLFYKNVDASLSREISTFFTTMPNLMCLSIFFGQEVETFPLHPQQLSQLTKLLLSHPAPEMLSVFCRAAPNLTTLHIQFAKNRESETFQLEPGHFSRLTELRISNGLNIAQLAVLLHAAPNLKMLSIVSCNDLRSETLQLLPGQLSQLTKLRVEESNITQQQLAVLLHAAPNLKMLSIVRCNGLRSETLQLLPGQLSQLTDLWVRESNITQQQFAVLLHAAPNAEILAIDCPNILLSVSQVRNDQLFLDGHLMRDLTAKHHARILFKKHQPRQPQPHVYHCNAYHWNPLSASFQMYVPKTLTDSLATSFAPEEVLEVFASNTDYQSTNHFYGQVELEGLNPDTWYQLPALGTQDKLLAYATTIADCEIKQDRALGYYYLKTHYPEPFCRINYIVESEKLPYSLAARLVNALMFMRNKLFKQSLLPLIERLHFNEQGQLVCNKEYAELKKQTKRELITALTEFCTFPNESAPAISGEGVALLNQLIQLRAGACRHRAMLFTALASALEIDALYITNDIHAFVVATDDSQPYYTIDLGGARVDNLLQYPMRPLPPAVVSNARPHCDSNVDTSIPKPSPKTRPRVLSQPPLAPPRQVLENNPFQTWNNLPLRADTIEELAQELLPENNTLSRRLIIMPQGELAIEALHDAVFTNKGDYFFTPNLDSLALKELKTSEGRYERADTQLAAFLRQAQQKPEIKFTWFINWSHAKAEHVGLNSLIDDVDRHLNDIMLTDNLHIVVVMDPISAGSMSDDFYSRFDAISQAPTRLTLPPLPSSQGKKVPIDQQDALIPIATDWKKILLGYHCVKGRQLSFMPGALLHALKNTSTTLKIHNAPWENSEFRWMMSELLRHRHVYANGNRYELPEALQIECVQSDYQYPSVEKLITNDAQEFIVNQQTYTHFFPHYRVSSSGDIESCPGFLNANPALTLKVTDYLSEVQWFKLWQAAYENQCQLAIQCTPNVHIPDGLRPWEIEPTALMPYAPTPTFTLTALIISNDLDYAQAQCPSDVLTVSISLNSRFEHLFCHTHRTEEGFVSTKTNLLTAIHAGKAIVLKGRFSKVLAQQLQTLFTKTPSLYINGETILISSSITLISDDDAAFTAIKAKTITYNPEMDFQKVTAPLQESLRALYASLKITPCHSHFIDLPEDINQQEQWYQTLSQHLQLAAGLSFHPEHATNATDILNYLGDYPFVVLLSETGEGKSYFVQHILPGFAQQQGRTLSIHYGMESIKSWIAAEGEAYLFFDEFNLSAEDFMLFDNLARREPVIWLDGHRYDITPGKKIIFAGNSKLYVNRFEADLFRRFPHYFEFKGQPLRLILEPLLARFEKPTELLSMIESYYHQALTARLNITPRNAQMMCIVAFTLAQLPLTRHLPEQFLMQYAALKEIQRLTKDCALTETMQRMLEKEGLWRVYSDAIDQALSLPLQTGTDYIWTESRRKLALSIQLLLAIRERKVCGEIDQAIGINALFLEGEAGLGKSQLLKALLQARATPYMLIDIGKPHIMRGQLLEAFHEGQVAIIDEPNSFPDEQLLNALLSGIDLDGNTAKKPGFFLLGTQNPITYFGRKQPSKAYENRVIKLQLDHLEPAELKYILEQRYSLDARRADHLTALYTQARMHAKSQQFFPEPNPRALFKHAKQVVRDDELKIMNP